MGVSAHEHRKRTCINLKTTVFFEMFKNCLSFACPWFSQALKQCFAQCAQIWAKLQQTVEVFFAINVTRWHHIPNPAFYKSWGDTVNKDLFLFFQIDYNFGETLFFFLWQLSLCSNCTCSVFWSQEWEETTLTIIGHDRLSVEGIFLIVRE